METIFVLLVLGWIGGGLFVFERLLRRQGDSIPIVMIVAFMIYLGVPMILATVIRGG